MWFPAPRGREATLGWWGSDVPGWGGRPEVQKQQEEGSAQGGKAPRVSHAPGGQATEGCVVSCLEGFWGPLRGCWEQRWWRSFSSALAPKHPKGLLRVLENDLAGSNPRTQHDLQGNTRISTQWCLGVVGYDYRGWKVSFLSNTYAGRWGRGERLDLVLASEGPKGAPLP